ncbi:NAD-dependent epimerase/dehydratase family protein [Roseimaritima ulvae]|uniref:GDP-6-deoxy-D-talose 4-dehydrogenase n=1 Tax=Roseimaritima ulvae TaxID=980254 RepID=A0A5B9QTY6_9BACT|nr:NAD-dependent epimerase/dehydratase family protein [Roseimaritima ulvae]QEG42498.1 GDP-6-deoxy-D-talose 4-dehydrogenase [Roseimaritima ulvae]
MTVSDKFEDCKILITGGAGFVGSEVVRQFSQLKNASLAVLDNFASGRRDFLSAVPECEIEEIDLLDRENVFRCVDRFRPDFVVHLAAIHFIPYCNRFPAECIRVNIEGTQNLLDALLNSSVRRVVAASSAAVYPIHDGACGESSVSPEPTDVYGLSKLCNEMQLQQFHAKSGVDSAAARFFNVYGPRETNPHVIPELLNQLLEGASELKLGNLEPKRDYIHVEDVARACIALAADASGFGAYNVGTGTEFSVAEIVSHFKAISARPFEVVQDKNKVRKSDRMHLRADTSKIQEAVGFTAKVGFADGLADLWDWGQANPVLRDFSGSQSVRMERPLAGSDR